MSTAGYDPAAIRRRRMLAAFRGQPEPVETPLGLAERARAEAMISAYGDGSRRPRPGPALRIRAQR